MAVTAQIASRSGVEVTATLDPAGLGAIKRLFDEFPKAANRAIMRAVNTAAVSANKQVISAIRRDLPVKREDIVGHRWGGVRLFKATPDNPFTARIEVRRVDTSERGKKARAGRLPAIRFSARQTRRGTGFRIQRSGARTFVKHAFIQTMASGHRGVFVRARWSMGMTTWYATPTGLKMEKDTLVKMRFGRKWAYARVSAGSTYHFGHGYVGPRGSPSFKKREPLVELFGPSIPHVAVGSPDLQAQFRVDVSATLNKRLLSQLALLMEGRRAVSIAESVE